ncbi:hypothetical protein GDO78_017186 [Eleutherodactylus coqui]|uniref:Uncharacterized protein n=1 Tax=Eleutherodactylus coqui TaxID=57060 RepID=A0A8J6EKP0_ELECQ|nr:hypothetical protein GDO78_017186 [Eleutherodactylus coqui]
MLVADQLIIQRGKWTSMEGQTNNDTLLKLLKPSRLMLRAHRMCHLQCHVHPRASCHIEISLHWQMHLVVRIPSYSL